MDEPINPEEFTRLANNFYIANNLAADYQRIIVDSRLCEYIYSHKDEIKKKYKIALVCICLNPPYWEFAKPMIEGAKQFFLPGHQVDCLFWSDMPDITDTQYFERLEKDSMEINFKNNPSIVNNSSMVADLKVQVRAEIDVIKKTIESIRNIKELTIFPTEPVEWPLPTLLRYNLFLQQEEKLRKYDYVFYCDIDMRFVNVVGDEILGDGLTATQHPMYALRKEYCPPYEPNKESTAYIPRSGRIIDDNGKSRFIPLYYAGGLQGGKTDEFIKAMKIIKKNIDTDFNKNYIAIWNDESHWNKYLFENPPEIVLTPSYCYPDSLIKEYYEPIWGCSYLPKLITLTKKFTITSEGGQAVNKMVQETKSLQK